MKNFVFLRYVTDNFQKYFLNKMKILLFFSYISEALFNPALIQEYVIKLGKFSCKESTIIFIS